MPRDFPVGLDGDVGGEREFLEVEGDVEEAGVGDGWEEGSEGD
jgi:hypothetical protein